MKLYRFTASNTHKAILTINETLGPNALVYSTRKIHNGVEILAGLPLDKDDEPHEEKIAQPIQVEKTLPTKAAKSQQPAVDSRMYDNLKLQLETMNENLQVLSTNMSILQQAFVESMTRKRGFNWGFLKKFAVFKLFRVSTYSRRRTTN